MSQEVSQIHEYMTGGWGSSSSLGENLLEQSKNFGDIQLNIFQVEEVLIVFLL